MLSRQERSSQVEGDILKTKRLEEEDRRMEKYNWIMGQEILFVMASDPEVNKSFLISMYESLNL